MEFDDNLLQMIEEIKQQIPESKRDKCFVVIQILRPPNQDVRINIFIYEKTKESLKSQLVHLPKYQKIRSHDPILSDTCSICCEQYETGLYKRELPCHHVFHKKCIDKWLVQKMNCPLCKMELHKKK